MIYSRCRRIIASVRQIHVIDRKGITSESHQILKLDSAIATKDLDMMKGKAVHHSVPWLSNVSSTSIRSMKPFLLPFWPFSYLFDPLYRRVHPSVYRYMRKHRLYGFSNFSNSQRYVLGCVLAAGLAISYSCLRSKSTISLLSILI